MSSVGVGAVTGLYSAYTVSSAILIDNPTVFDGVKRSLEGATSERQGYPGFRSVVGTFRGSRIALVQVPPYPQAVVEATGELYVLGARRVVLVARGYRLSRRVASQAVLIAQGAVPRDSMSPRIVKEGVPLLAGQQMLSKLRKITEMRFPDVSWVTGLTVTVDSVRTKWTLPMAEDLIGVRGVHGVDTMVAPLYAMQYEYSNLEAVAMITLYRQYSRIAPPLESPADAYSKLLEKEARAESILYTVALELLSQVAREVQARR